MNHSSILPKRCMRPFQCLNIHSWPSRSDGKSARKPLLPFDGLLSPLLRLRLPFWARSKQPRPGFGLFASSYVLWRHQMHHLSVASRPSSRVAAGTRTGILQRLLASSCMIRHGQTHHSSNGCCKPDVLESSPQFSFGLVVSALIVAFDRSVYSTALISLAHSNGNCSSLRCTSDTPVAFIVVLSTLGWNAIDYFSSYSISCSFGALLSSDRVQSPVNGVNESRYFCCESMCSTANKFEPSSHQNGL